MPTLSNYHHFAGRHHETGVIHNYYAHSGAQAPHTGQPYSEALLLGISGGIAMGYFTFAYKGYDPHVALLTRNTFDPLETLLSRLGASREFRKTNKPEKAVRNVIDLLENGEPALVWADRWSLPYNALQHDDGMWGNFPIIVFGYEPEEDRVHIADRASVPLSVTLDELMASRARIKKDKFQILHLGLPDPERLPAAVSSGIWDCINLFTEKPPKGTRKNFGFAAYEHWISLLRKAKQRLSWEKEFPAGSKMYAALVSTFDHMGTTGILGDADRALYADFLDEATVVLSKSALREPAAQFRESSAAWRQLGRVLLPDGVPSLRETRELMTKRRHLFINEGNAAVPRMAQIDQRLAELRAEAQDQFPLNKTEVQDLRDAIATQLEIIHDIEKIAVRQLRSSMSQ